MNGRHTNEILNLLRQQLGNDAEVDDIASTAREVMQKWVNPVGDGREQTNGLIYGLVQSGKTGVLTVTGAMGADEGYQTLIVLTSDIDPLYEQTRGRIQEAFPGMDILGKVDLRDPISFSRRIKAGKCAIVVTKNGSVLQTLIDNVKEGKVRDLACLIIDDEADQASLNTKARRNDGTQSKINEQIQELRGFFHRNTYLQVTATPGALFLQENMHAFRPKFTVLSHPGSEYVGGDDFFAQSVMHLVREFPLEDLTTLSAGMQPTPGTQVPGSLLAALDTFIIGATYKRQVNPDAKCAFLCHVSTRTDDHRHIVELLRKYKSDLGDGLRAKNTSLIARLRAAFDDLACTDKDLAKSDFGTLVNRIEFLSPGIHVRLVNGETDEDVALHAPYSLFVGGNKLGRGVTIKNLLVSYYGRHPRTPQADTVLQHARMYGYRRNDIGLLRLWLPPQLHAVFRAINHMERSLRRLIAESPDEAFRCIYLENSLQATRRNVLVPGAIGVYTGGGTYNPAQVLRDDGGSENTAKLDDLLATIRNKQVKTFSISDLQELIRLTKPDPSASEHVWDPIAIAESLKQCADILEQETGYVYVDRDRDLREPRRETQGLLTGGEASAVPIDRVTIFMMRTKKYGAHHAVWWPQIRFPTGRYALAFAI
ncbi:MAG: Z1 domain-containing protein [Planctomycetota bacterium]